MQNFTDFLINTPEGTRDRLWSEQNAQRGAERKLTALFAERGYLEVSTPILEYYDLYRQARNPIPAESMITLVGRDGRLLVLRPDCTTPIARIAATRKLPLPCRLYYNQSVYRRTTWHHGDSIEVAQCGVELFGIDGIAGDGEIVELAIDALLAVEVKEFHLELGGLDGFALEAIRGSLPADKREYVRFEPTLTQDIEYYTGLVFRAYATGSGKAVLAGGRYDRLTGDFGRAAPGVGFAVYVDEVLRTENASASNERLMIAVTKGRMLEESLALFEKIGLNCPAALSDKDDRRLVHDIPGSNVSIVLAKAADVLTYVERGVCQLGIVGYDTILENGGNFTELADLRFSACKFALAGYGAREIRTVASKYPNVAKQYFAKKGTDVDIIKIDGSVELAPLLNLADAIVDIVQSGGTLKANGLQILDDIVPVSARLIANSAALRLKKDEIAALTDKISAEV
jgi:ATP phosphoribosyltransferase